MEKHRVIRFGDLQQGDELRLQGDGLDIGAIVLRVYPSEIVLHWLDMEDPSAVQATVLGMHLDPSKTEPFAPRFVPGELWAGKAFVVYVPLEDDRPEARELRYLKVTRSGQTIHEAGIRQEPDDTTSPKEE